MVFGVTTGIALIAFGGRDDRAAAAGELEHSAVAIAEPRTEPLEQKRGLADPGISGELSTDGWMWDVKTEDSEFLAAADDLGID